MGVYGKCATCGEDNIGAERRPDGDAFCKNGHKTTRRQLSDDVLLSSNKELTARLTALESDNAALREERNRLHAAIHVMAWATEADANIIKAYMKHKREPNDDEMQRLRETTQNVLAHREIIEPIMDAPYPIAAAAVKGGGQ